MASQTTRLRGRPSRGKIRGKSQCTWCDHAIKTVSYVDKSKPFCSEGCIRDYRKAYSNGACASCNNPIRNIIKHTTSLNESKNFCSIICANEYEKPAKSNDDRRRKPYDKPNNNRYMNNDLPLSPTSAKINPNFTDWDSYLKETSSEAAPAYCFKQYAVAPENKFDINMKLEAKDNRNPTSTCLATVVAKIGPRLKLRLDGNDTSNDFWRLVDAKDIYSYGTTEERGGMLQPPFGFRHNQANFNSFLKKSLNGANIASKDLFVEEPPRPGSNLFKPGQKLEAVDPHCPEYISVATVDQVNEEEISVIIDGCNKSYGFNCRYDSRDIFPVGWCEKCDHPLQHGRKITVPSKGRVRMIHVISEGDSSEITPSTQRIDVPESSTSPSLAPPVALIEADTSTNSSKPVSTSFVSTSSECDPEPFNNVLKSHSSSNNSEDVTTSAVVKSNGKVFVTEQEAATSTTTTETTTKLPPDPTDWTVENVIHYISHAYPPLETHAHVFRSHEIDGKAFLLLKYDTLMKYMEMKLGPAVKICSLIKKIENKRQYF